MATDTFRSFMLMVDLRSGLTLLLKSPDALLRFIALRGCGTAMGVNFRRSELSDGSNPRQQQARQGAILRLWSSPNPFGA